MNCSDLGYSMYGHRRLVELNKTNKEISPVLHLLTSSIATMEHGVALNTL